MSLKCSFEDNVSYILAVGCYFCGGYQINKKYGVNGQCSILIHKIQQLFPPYGVFTLFPYVCDKPI